MADNASPNESLSSLASNTTKPSPYTYGLTGTNQGANMDWTYVLLSSMLGLCAVVLGGRLLQIGNAHLRHLFTLTAEPKQQAFWSTNQNRWFPAFKKHFLYAPFWKKRHNREMRLSAALNMGTLPSRFHATLLGLYLVGNIIFCATLDYSQSKPHILAELRGRTGHLAIVNMIPLVVFAGRNNPLIGLLRVSFDTYNLLHRWMGRMVVAEGLAHTFAWATTVVATDPKGWGAVMPRIHESAFLMYGLICVIFLGLILISTPSVFRHAFYETFLHLHLAMVIVVFVTAYYHIKVMNLPQLPYMHAILGIWFAERSIRVIRIVYRNVSRRRMTTLSVQALPGEACRVTITVPRPWNFRAGSHLYLTLPSVALWQSHPFSVAWSEQSLVYRDPRGLQKEKLDIEQPGCYETSVSLVIHKRTGMTASLYEKAIASPQGQLHLRGFVEGPYGGHDSLHSYGTVVLFAGGIGITHQVPHVRELIAGYKQGVVATRKILLVWIVRNTEHLEWVRPWMDQILAMPGRREVLRILLFVTKPKSPREVVSPSTTVQMFPGRPNAQTIIDKEISERIGAMAVTVCGPGGLADNVRHAVRRRVDVASLDFVEEAFTW